MVMRREHADRPRRSVLKIEIIQNFNAPTPLLCTLEFCYMKFVAFWTVEDAGPYKFVRLFRTRARVFVSLPLEGKETAAGCRMRCRMRSIRLEKE